MPHRDLQHFAKDPERIKFAMNAAGIGIWEVDIARNQLIWDDNCCALFGLKNQYVLSYDESLRYIHPDDLADVTTAIEAALQGKQDGLYDATYRTIGGDNILRWVNFTGTAYFDEVGEAIRFGGVAKDITAQVSAKQAQEKSAAFQSLLSDSVPAMIFYLDTEQRYTSYNQTFRQWFDVDDTEALGKTTREFIGEAAYERIKSNLDKAYAGERVHFEMRAPAKIGEDRWVSIVYTPHKDQQGCVQGVIVHATEVTQSKRLEHALRESEGNFRSLIEQSPTAICLFLGRDLKIELANDLMLQSWGKSAEIIGQPLRIAMPELEGQPFFDVLGRVTGETFHAAEAPATVAVNGQLVTYYFNYTCKAIRNGAGEIYGIINTNVNVTDQVLARRAKDESSERLRALITSAPAAIGIFLGEDLIVDMPNDAFIDIVGRGPDIAGKPLSVVMPELAGEGQPFLRILKDVYQNGSTFKADAAPVKIRRDGELVENHFNVTFSPLRDAAGSIYGILDISIDVTEAVRARQKVEESETALAAAIELAELGTWSIDAATKQTVYSERLQSWLGVRDAILDIDASARIHPADQERVGAALRHALSKGSDGKFNEIYTIIHATTHTPRIIHASGQVYYDGQGNPVRLSGTAQDITIQKDMQSALEQEVQLRTEELAAAIEELQATNEELTDSNEQLLHSNEELAQYAYVASHDLQEPLRKIRVFSNMLGGNADLTTAGKDLVTKIGSSAERMSLLIQDLLEFSRLLKSDALYRTVNLNKVVQDVFSDFELVAAEKHATFDLGTLPVIEAVGLQMNQLFYNLVSNSLKFTKEGVDPLIHITAERATTSEIAEHIRDLLPFATYYKICVTDNGIGFEKQYADQIFEVFKRLHGKDSYPGSGIGLALCRRIMANHGGSLYTQSDPGQGATFCLILPDKQHDIPSALPEGLKFR